MKDVTEMTEYEFNRHQGADVAAQEIAHLVNNMSLDYAEVARVLSNDTHRTLQQNFMRLAMAFIVAQAKKTNNNYDGRNEATVKLAKRLLKDLELPYDLYLPHV